MGGFLTKIKYYPVDSKGNMSTYFDAEWDSFAQSHIPMRREPIVPFIETMTFQRIEQGRSALRAILYDSTGREWSLFANSIELFFQNSVNGVLKGEYIVAKRGANYGLILNEVM